jgi:hypothetical protein
MERTAEQNVSVIQLVHRIEPLSSRSLAPNNELAI